MLALQIYTLHHDFREDALLLYYTKLHPRSQRHHFTGHGHTKPILKEVV